MSPVKLDLSAGWRRRPEPAEASARRAYRMLTALATVDGRFAGLLEGGHSPNPKTGWRPLEVSEAALTRLLLRSDKHSNTPGFAGVLIWVFGAWNGHPDEGTSMGLGAVVEGPVPYPMPLRSHAGVGGGIDELDPEQVDSIVAAVMDAWDPDDATRRELTGGTWRVRTFARGEGWREQP